MGLLRMSAGIAVWAAHFALLYGFTSFACARGPIAAIPWVAGAATFVALAAVAAIVVRSFPARARFAPWMTAAIAGLAAIAIVFEALAVAMVPACR